jgi:hypothetical protein
VRPAHRFIWQLTVADAAIFRGYAG